MITHQTSCKGDILRVWIILLVLAFHLISNAAAARNYYFSNSLGDDTRTSTQAQSSATPWKTITKLNSFFSSLAVGDSVLFKRGDTFYGSIIVSNSGTSSSPITLGAFGTGAKPIITGLQTIAGWTNTGGGIYSKVVTVESSPNLLLIEGVQYAMGRYPNTGWLYYESHSGLTSITDNQLPSTPNWTGAEAIICKNNWTIDRNPITNHSGTTLMINNGYSWGLTNGYGYFIQKSLSTLDQYGEWYYNTANSTLYVYFGAVDPTTKTVDLPIVNNGIAFTSGVDYITLSNLAIKGTNKIGVNIDHNDFITVKDCDINFSGNSGITLYVADNTTIQNNTINYCNDWGVITAASSDNVVMIGNTISNIETIFGQGISNYMSGNAIFSIQGENIRIEKNTINNISYCGMHIGANNQIVRNNYIANSMQTKQDGGAIYLDATDLTAGVTINGNVIVGTIGRPEGKPIGYTSGAGNGIYIDQGSSYFTSIDSNSISGCKGHGIFIHASQNIGIRANTVYDCSEALYMQETPEDGSGYNYLPITNMNIKNNKFVAKETTQLASWGRLNTGHVWTGIGTLDKNWYARPISDVSPIKAMITAWDATAINLSAWKTLTGQDANSQKSPVTISNTSDLRFEYNATSTDKVVSLGSSYIDVTGTVYSNSITIAPYSSVVLIKSQSTGSNSFPSIQNQNFQLNENSPNGTNVGKVIATDPDAGQILSYSITSGNTNGAFTINASTGILTVANSSALNFEITPSFALIVKVQDNGPGNLGSQANITISLVDINEAPVISDQTVSVNTTTTNGTAVKVVSASDPDAGQVLTYSIVSGNTGNAFTINPSTGVLIVANSSALNLETTLAFALTTKVQDNGAGNLTNQATVYVNLTNDAKSCSATGTIAYQKWTGIGGSEVSYLTANTNYPDNPSSAILLTSLEAPLNATSDFGARMAGYICAPLTGSYTFWIASGGNSELWLSTDNQPANKIKIAYVNGYTDSRQWNKYTTQKSVQFNLIQGQTYYVEALMANGNGQGNFALG